MYSNREPLAPPKPGEPRKARSGSNEVTDYSTIERFAPPVPRRLESVAAPRFKVPERRLTQGPPQRTTERIRDRRLRLRMEAATLSVRELAKPTVTSEPVGHRRPLLGPPPERRERVDADRLVPSASVPSGRVHTGPPRVLGRTQLGEELPWQVAFMMNIAAASALNDAAVVADRSEPQLDDLLGDESGFGQIDQSWRTESFDPEVTQLLPIQAPGLVETDWSGAATASERVRILQVGELDDAGKTQALLAPLALASPSAEELQAQDSGAVFEAMPDLAASAIGTFESRGQEGDVAEAMGIASLSEIEWLDTDDVEDLNSQQPPPFPGLDVYIAEPTQDDLEPCFEIDSPPETVARKDKIHPLKPSVFRKGEEQADVSGLSDEVQAEQDRAGWSPSVGVPSNIWERNGLVERLGVTEPSEPGDRRPSAEVIVNPEDPAGHLLIQFAAWSSALLVALYLSLPSITTSGRLVVAWSDAIITQRAHGFSLGALVLLVLLGALTGRITLRGMGATGIGIAMLLIEPTQIPMPLGAGCAAVVLCCLAWRVVNRHSGIARALLAGTIVLSTGLVLDSHYEELQRFMRTEGVSLYTDWIPSILLSGLIFVLGAFCLFDRVLNCMGSMSALMGAWLLALGPILSALMGADVSNHQWRYSLEPIQAQSLVAAGLVVLPLAIGVLLAQLETRIGRTH